MYQKRKKIQEGKFSKNKEKERREVVFIISYECLLSFFLKGIEWFTE